MIDANEIRIAISSEMPDNASIFERHELTKLVYETGWHIKTDPERPYKLSRIIHIVIPREIVEDARESEIRGNKGHLDRLKNYLKGQLASFNPGHNEPKHNSPPIETWLVNSDHING